MRLKFGAPEPGVTYEARPTAFGLAVDDRGRLACVEVDRGEGPYLDLPGGALDGQETEQEALSREFGEETGLRVRAVERIAEASQLFRKTDGHPVDNQAGFWTAEVLASEPELKCEDDHTLVWIAPEEALRRLRHEAHAWAVAAWLRRG
ncbi:MAG: NUDIX domain-containing protein [Brevundimonas sp.]